MNRINLETSLIQNIHQLPDDKLVELFDFATFLASRLSTPDTQKKLGFVEFIRHSPLCGIELELERDQSVCRMIEL